MMKSLVLVFLFSSISPAWADALHYYRVTADSKSVIQVARDVYGDQRVWKKIAAWNALKEPYELSVGDILVLKDKPKRKILGRHVVVEEDRPKTIKVADASPVSVDRNIQREQGHSLYIVNERAPFLSMVALELYGDVQMMKEMVEWNHLPKPYRLYLGQKLVLKKKPTRSVAEGNSLLSARWRQLGNEEMSEKLARVSTQPKKSWTKVQADTKVVLPAQEILEEEKRAIVISTGTKGKMAFANKQNRMTKPQVAHAPLDRGLAAEASPKVETADLVEPSTGISKHSAVPEIPKTPVVAEESGTAAVIQPGFVKDARLEIAKPMEETKPPSNTVGPNAASHPDWTANEWENNWSEPPRKSWLSFESFKLWLFGTATTVTEVVKKQTQNVASLVPWRDENKTVAPPSPVAHSPIYIVETSSVPVGSICITPPSALSSDSRWVVQPFPVGVTPSFVNPAMPPMLMPVPPVQMPVVINPISQTTIETSTITVKPGDGVRAPSSIHGFPENGEPGTDNYWLGKEHPNW